MKKDKFNILRTKPWDVKFHRSRRMFCIKDGRVEVGPTKTKDSHLEWFKKEGWVNEENAEEFLNKVVRGFYLPSENGLYCYRGVGFWYDDEVIKEIIGKLPQLKKALNLNDDTKICFGPKDSPLEGIKYPRHCSGTLKELLK